MTTLYEKLGGKDAVDIAVDKFYEHVINDERIKHFFDEVDMKKQRGHQNNFFNLNGKHFETVIENFLITLKELGISDE